jgi:diaminopimelate epimerase
MCDNAARCAARLAMEIGAAPPAMRIETLAGILSAEVSAAQVKLAMPPPRAWRIGQVLELGGQRVGYGFVNTGVPHAVVEVADLPRCDVAGTGRAIRRHPAFAPDGTNANFVAVTGPHTLSIRTYERGVEGETLACGTGITAAALLMARQGAVRPPVDVLTAGGDVLTVDFRLEPDGARDVTLCGPAVHVFEGVLDYAARGARANP